MLPRLKNHSFYQRYRRVILWRFNVLLVLSRINSLSIFSFFRPDRVGIQKLPKNFTQSPSIICNLLPGIHDLYYRSIFAPFGLKKEMKDLPREVQGILFKRPESQKSLSKGHPTLIFPSLIAVRFLISPLNYNEK
jgi:hypothetical protein